MNQSPFNKLKEVGGSIATQANSFDSSGILLFRQSESTILAFSRRCTHAGVAIDAFKDGSARCASHGSEFNLSGEPTKGPASSKLEQYKVEIINDIIKAKKLITTKKSWRKVNEIILLSKILELLKFFIENKIIKKESKKDKTSE